MRNINKKYFFYLTINTFIIVLFIIYGPDVHGSDRFYSSFTLSQINKLLNLCFYFFILIFVMSYKNLKLSIFIILQIILMFIIFIKYYIKSKY